VRGIWSHLPPHRASRHPACDTAGRAHLNGTRLTPTRDTNEPGQRQTKVDRYDRSAQANDSLGHLCGTF
jgi:hypothetical protein